MDARTQLSSVSHRARGFSLVEVLVAVLVLSIGLLGHAGLQAQSLQYNHSAQMRSQATLLANGIMDALRSQRTASLDGEFDITFEAEVPADAPPALAHWRETLTESLPNGTGSIDVDADRATVVIRWDDSRGKGDPIELQWETRL